MQRKIPLKADPEKTRAWRARSQPIGRSTATGVDASTPRSLRPNSSLTSESTTESATAPSWRRPASSGPRRNDAPWRAEVFELRGGYCRVPACGGRDLQCDHLIPRSQGGPSVVPNGWPLCRAHHEAKTAHELKIRPEWLDEDQVEWLATEGHATWGEDGEVRGRHRRLFTVRGETWLG
jgi:5-methylcytosine-specific restriction endonuclease McrA